MMFKSFFKHALLILAFAGWLSAEFGGAQPAEHPGFAKGFAEASPACRLDFYFIPGCEQCRQIGENMFSQIRELFGDRVKIRKHNLYESVEYAEMLKARAALNITRKDNVFFIVDGLIYVGGLKDIRENLIPTVEERLLSGSRFMPPGQAQAERPPSGNALRLPIHHDGLHEMLPAHSRSAPDAVGGRRGSMAGGRARPMAGGYSFPFSFAALSVAGLIDGLNPCAFATIVFLISSLLAGGSGRKEHLFLIGLGFCSSVYLTYFLIGLGLFQVFRLSFMRLWLSNMLNGLLIVGLLIMAFISFRDAWIFRLTGRPKDIILKLPGRIDRLIHNIIHSNLPRKHYFAGSFFLGCVVTILESICTGQLYVPALAFLARTSPLRVQAIAGLALYNLMFILPLVAVFVLAYHGVGHRALVAWSRKDFFWAKCALGCFFVFLAVVLYVG